MMRTDVLVIGSGAAGLLLALHAAQKGLAVTIATKGTIEESNTAWAQGGVAASLDLEEDSAAAHLADTLAAGAGLVDDAAAALVAAEAPTRVEELRELGVAFNLAVTGELALTREGIPMRLDGMYTPGSGGKATPVRMELSHLRLGPQEPTLFSVPPHMMKLPAGGLAPLLGLRREG